MKNSFDYSDFAAKILADDNAWAAPLENALRARVFLCVIWQEALRAVSMVRGNGTELQMSLALAGDGFMLERGMRYISFTLATPPVVKVFAPGFQPSVDHIIETPTSAEKMAEASQAEVKTAIALLLR